MKGLMAGRPVRGLGERRPHGSTLEVELLVKFPLKETKFLSSKLKLNQILL